MKAKPSVEEALGLPTTKDLNKLLGKDDSDDSDELESTGLDEYTMNDLEKAKNSMNQLKEYREQLKDIPDITKRKQHLDRLAKLAESKFEDVFDRGFNCEDRFMAEVIKAANDMLKIALEAHAKVIESDIKLIDLQLKKDKAEIELNQKISESTNKKLETPQETEKLIPKTRNEILASMNKNK